MRLRLIGPIAALLAVCLGSTPALASSSREFQSPRHYYLALGDSLAFGFQQGKFLAEVNSGTYNPASFNTGYVDDIAARLRDVRENIRTVNLGCPGETTLTFINGGCTFTLPLHTAYGGPQQAAALAFLRAHPNQVSPITLDDGANDITPCQASPDPNCFANKLQQVGADLNASLAAIRAVAPRSEIILMQYYNPLYVVAPSTDVLVGLLNGVIAAAAAPYGARLANAFPVINHNPAFPSEAASVCGLTGMCFPPPGGDVHANDAGYALIAGQFWAASSYGERDEEGGRGDQEGQTGP
jgi:lysophospholipase L1-like esterase